MKAIPIKSYLVNVRNKDCPLPNEMKNGKGLTWTDNSIIRCVGCVFFKGISLCDAQMENYDVDGYVEVGEPDQVFCMYKG